MKPLVCAITGANGQIGSYLVDHFRNNGYIVYELARSKEKVKDEIYYQYFDLSQPPVGKRPVYGVRNQESQLPNILTKDYPSPIAGRDAGCLQPKWGPKCI